MRNFCVLFVLTLENVAHAVYHKRVKTRDFKGNFMKRKTMRTDYPTKEIARDTYIICDFGFANCYLLVGQDRALLIDCGVGIGDMKGAVEKITDKPLVVVGTHGHVDHIGGDGQFDKIYLHKDDAGRNYKFQTSRILRKLFVFAGKGVVDKSVRLSDVVKFKNRPQLVAIEDGHVFDLGGRKVVVKHLTGHTLGSILLIDEQSGIVFVGDNISPSIWLFLPHASTVEEWIESAKEIYRITEKYTAYWGHEQGSISRELIAHDIALGEEILAKYKRNRHRFAVKFYPCNDRVNGSVVFRVSRIFKKK